MAQIRPAVVVGHVSDRSTKKPLAGVDVTNGNDGRSTATDSAGRFTLNELTPGKSRLIVRALGFPVLTFNVDLPIGDTLVQSIQLDSTAEGRSRAQTLPEVGVTAPRSLGPRYADFERRMKTGRGQYMTADQIESGRYYSLQEAVRDMRGVEISCGGGGGCYIKMARAPMQCTPEYIVDERVDNIFGPNTPIRDIQGLEVYNGPSDVPGEFAGRNAGCGVIVIWTKSGPTRRPH
ncbi:MAG: carboxypeptidase regulatory-like domain-containing protein [Gemmatimonadota bacterium]|nr:carboxypeptidase regulatory-like domain-containing protein [Gemmatimonadota bacterium]